LALRRCCPLKFLYALEIDQALIAHTQMGMGVPPLPKKTFDRVNLKFGLKFSVCAAITSEIVGIFSPNFSRPRGELWSTNEKVIARILIDPPDLLVYRKLITQVYTTRGSFWSHSLAAIAARGISIT